jgi:hypothetical protein
MEISLLDLKYAFLESMLKGTELTQEDIDRRFNIINQMHGLNAKEGDRQWTQKSDLKVP